MIELLSQTEAERRGIDPRRIQCITPYLNPAHVLSPPRQWLEALVREEYGWHFFRLRYKNLLRNRYRAEPERFHALLEESQRGQSLYLTCHCLTNHCHREIAREYLEMLRKRIAQQTQTDALATPVPRIPGLPPVLVSPVLVPPVLVPSTAMTPVMESSATPLALPG